jgi:hypothetical protein
MLHSVLTQNAEKSLPAGKSAGATASLARSFAWLTSENEEEGKESPAAREFGSWAELGCSLDASSGGGSPNSETCAFDVHSGLRKLDLARNNSDENVLATFKELRVKLKTYVQNSGGRPACDVSI